MSTFLVFQDVPAVPAAVADAPNSDDAGTKLKRLTNVLPPTASTEKENVNPVTGELARVGGEAKSKKRKTAVLATKAYAPLGDVRKEQKEHKEQREQKEYKERKPEAKKRKSSSVTSTAVSSSLKATQGSGSSRKGRKGTRSSRKPLQTVAEESEKDAKKKEAEKDSASQREAERLEQADVESRVYELTVRPLADITQAYEQGPPAPSKTKLRALKVCSPLLVSEVPLTCGWDVRAMRVLNCAMTFRHPWLMPHCHRSPGKRLRPRPRLRERSNLFPRLNGSTSTPHSRSLLRPPVPIGSSSHEQLARLLHARR
jgi:hypothetical protein